MKMTNEQILTKAIQKALEGGWRPHYEPRYWNVREILHWYKLGEFASSQWHDDNWKKFIFSHDFAKALWGTTQPNGKLPKEILITKGGTFKLTRPFWKIHLSRMVIAPDPVEYLGKNI